MEIVVGVLAVAVVVLYLRLRQVEQWGGKAEPDSGMEYKEMARLIEENLLDKDPGEVEEILEQARMNGREMPGVVPELWRVATDALEKVEELEDENGKLVERVGNLEKKLGS